MMVVHKITNHQKYSSTMYRLKFKKQYPYGIDGIYYTMFGLIHSIADRKYSETSLRLRIRKLLGICLLGIFLASK